MVERVDKDANKMTRAHGTAIKMDRKTYIRTRAQLLNIANNCVISHTIPSIPEAILCTWIMHA